MFIVGNFITALVKLVDMGLSLYMWVIVARAVVSWVNPDPYNPIVQFLYRVTEPAMALVRRWLPLRGLGIDLSPMIIIAAIMFIQAFLLKSLLDLAIYLR
jgi:YggT family protein